MVVRWPRGVVWFEFGLCCLMTLGLIEDIRCHVWQWRIQKSDDVYAHLKDTKYHSVPFTKLVCWWWFEVGGLVLGQYFNVIRSWHFLQTK